MLLAKEKAATHARDALAAERRRQPVVRIEKAYVFEGPSGKVSLLDIFQRRRQLILYHFMFGPGVDGWPEVGCPGCSMFVDQIGHLAHFHARDTSFALVSIAPLSKIEFYKKRMELDIPWYSSAGSDFNTDFGVTRDDAETFGLRAFSFVTKITFTEVISLQDAGSSHWAAFGRSRSHPVWQARRLGRLAERLAANPALYLVAASR